MAIRLRGGTAPVDWLIVGLGNPGARYAATPHSVGFDVARALASRWDLGKPRGTFNGEYYDGKIRPLDVGTDPISVGVLLPQTFMNESGRSVGPARGRLKTPLDRILVLHDEIDLKFGDIRCRLGGGLAGHNGLRSLKQHLGDATFGRVRVGVGRPEPGDPVSVADYVLSRWRQPQADVDAMIGEAADVAEAIVTARRTLA
ncbi:MAG: aminoacyl-tRNA hydrolase [Patulibacter sp.]